MDLVILVLTLVLIGFIVYVLTVHVPLPPLWARAIQVVALIVVLLYVLTRLVHLPNVLR